MLKRLAAFALAFVFIVAVIYLGWLSSKDAWYVPWFGIAAALVAPLGLALLGFAVRGSNSDVIQRLAKVPEIERLASEANSYEERIGALEVERARLAEIVQFESKRQFIRDRINSLESDGRRIIEELDVLDRELASLGEQAANSPARDEINRLRERVCARERGDVFLTLRGSTLRIDSHALKELPLGIGNVTLWQLRILAMLLDMIEALHSRNKKEKNKHARGETL